MHRVHWFWAVTLLLFLNPFPGTDDSATAAQNVPSPSHSIRELIDHIDASWVGPPLAQLASDKLKGRYTPSPGLDAAADFLGNALRHWGVVPAGVNGTYFQSVKLARSVSDEQTSSLALNRQRFIAGHDYFFYPADARLEAVPLVYGGAGWWPPSSSNSVEVAGRVVVLVKDDQLLTKRQRALEQGALGIIVIYPEQREWLADLTAARNPVWQSKACAADKLIARFTAVAAQIFFQDEPHSLTTILREKAQGRDVPAFYFKSAKRLNARIRWRCENNYPRNVLAKIEGTHPQEKNEYVALSAHYDHIGWKTDGNRTDCNCKGQDCICNGADDNGSGTVALLAIARALATAPVKPKRSILFIWHCGEEREFIGANYYVKSSLIPLHQLKVLLNADMIGRTQQLNDGNSHLAKKNQVYLFAEPQRFFTFAKHAIQKNNLETEWITDDHCNYRDKSDHHVYGKLGVPWLFFTTGCHSDWHQPTDEIAKVDFKKLVLVTQTILATAWEIAEDNGRF